METEFDRKVNAVYSQPWELHRKTIVGVYDNLSTLIMALVKRHDSEIECTRDLRQRLAHQTNANHELQHEIHILRGVRDEACEFCLEDIAVGGKQ